MTPTKLQRRDIATQAAVEMVDALSGLGWPRERIARRLDISVKTVRRWFRGDYPPTAAELIGLEMLCEEVLAETVQKDSIVREDGV